MRRILAVALVAVLAVVDGAGAMTDYNPNAATTVGLEFTPTVNAEQRIAAGAAGAVTITSTVAETGGNAIDLLAVPLSVAGGDATVIAEVYESGDETPGTITTTTYRPTDDLQIGGVDSESSAWITNALTTTNLYNRVDESTLDVSDWIAYFGTKNSRRRWRAQFGTGGWAADRRIVGGRIKIVASRAEVGGTLEVSYYDGTNTYRLGQVSVGTKRRVLSVPFPEYNPATGMPWTQGNITALAAAGTAAIQIRPGRAVGRNKLLKIFQMYLELDWIDENRVAVGVTEVPEQAAAYTPFSMKHPTSGADNWAKADATDYTVLVRRIDGDGIVGWQYLEETEQVADLLGRPTRNAGIPTILSYAPAMTGRGLVSSLGDRLDGRALGLVLQPASGGTSVDGSAYHEGEYVIVRDGQGAGQTFTTTNAGNYGQARFLLGAVTRAALGAAEGSFRPATDAEVAGLAGITVKIKNATTHATLATAVYTAAEVAAMPSVAQSLDPYVTDATLVTAEFATPAALLAATQYYLEVTTDEPNPTAVGDSAWALLYLDSTSGGASNPSFGGATDYLVTTDEATFGFTDTGSDVPFTVSIRPSAPAGFTATTSPQTVTAAAADGVGCAVGTVDTAALAWTSTGLGADFGRYEIQRLGLDGVTWHTILTPSAEATVAARDWEARQGQTARYRIRVVRDGDDVASPWSTEDTCDIAERADVILASNHLQDALGFTREPDYDWSFPSEREYLALTGRDYVTAFVEAENRGDRTDLPLVLFAGDEAQAEPDVPGRAVFDPLLDFAGADVPHFTMCDRDGWQTFCDLQVVKAARREPDSTYTAEVAVVETQDEPTAYDPDA